MVSYSSVRGVIFFSGSSSSANSFLYFSQFCPVALGILGGEVLCLRVDGISQTDDAVSENAGQGKAISVANRVSLL